MLLALYKAPPPKTVTLVTWFQYMKYGGEVNIQTTLLYKMVQILWKTVDECFKNLELPCDSRWLITSLTSKYEPQITENTYETQNLHTIVYINIIHNKKNRKK